MDNMYSAALTLPSPVCPHRIVSKFATPYLYWTQSIVDDFPTPKRLYLLDEYVCSLCAVCYFFPRFLGNQFILHADAILCFFLFVSFSRSTESVAQVSLFMIYVLLAVCSVRCIYNLSPCPIWNIITVLWLLFYYCIMPVGLLAITGIPAARRTTQIGKISILAECTWAWLSPNTHSRSEYEFYLSRSRNILPLRTPSMCSALCIRTCDAWCIGGDLT